MLALCAEQLIPWIGLLGDGLLGGENERNTMPEGFYAGPPEDRALHEQLAGRRIEILLNKRTGDGT